MISFQQIEHTIHHIHEIPPTTHNGLGMHDSVVYKQDGSLWSFSLVWPSGELHQVAGGDGEDELKKFIDYSERLKASRLISEVD